MPPPSKPTPALAAVRAEFTSLWERMASFWGVSPGAGRLFSGLLARGAPAGADELMEDLAMSRGAVSMAARELIDWGLVRTEREPGARRLLYVPETDLERAIRAIVTTRKRREWDPVLTHLREWIPRLESDASDEARDLRERLREIESVVALVDSMASSFLQGGLVQKLGLKAVVAAARRRRRRASS